MLNLSIDEEFIFSGARFKFTEEGLLSLTSGSWAPSIAEFGEIISNPGRIEHLTFKPKYGDVYHCITFTDSVPSISHQVWTNSTIDFMAAKLGIIHRTEQEAKDNFAADFYKLRGVAL